MPSLFGNIKIVYINGGIIFYSQNENFYLGENVEKVPKIGKKRSMLHTANPNSLICRKK